MSKKYFIPKKIESQNKHNKQHWTKYSKYKCNWFTAIGFICGKGNHQDKKQSIKITSVRKRLIDVSNLWGGIKPIPDALIKFGHIKDDSPKWLEIDVVQILTKDKKEIGTIIEVF